MQFRNQIGFCLLPLLLAAGCSTTVTNLTPRQQPRNETGFYPVEMIWNSNLQAIRKETLKPTVEVGDTGYPMKPTPMLGNRWETLVPVPAGKNSVAYRFRVDYEYNSIPVPRPDSVTSPVYELKITDK